MNTVPEPLLFLINKIKQENHSVYIVGGAVRDLCLKRNVTDWDLATSAPVSALEKIFKNTSHFIPGHGTFSVIIEGRTYEITAFRGATGTLQSDLAERDLTINAMALDPRSGKILDPHNGRRDLKSRILRAVENPCDRFRADPLRLLRTVRLAAQLDFRIHKGTRESISELSFLLSTVAPERIRGELMKLLLVPKPSGVFNMLITLGLIKEFLPELLEGRLKRQNHYHRFTILRHILKTVDYVEPTSLLRLTALLHDIAKPRIRFKKDGVWRFHAHEKASAELAGEIMKRLKFGNRMTQRVTHLIASHIIGYNPGWTDVAVRRLIKRVGPDAIKDLLAFRKADIRAHGKELGNTELLFQLEERIEKQLSSSPPLHVSDLAINGKDVMSLTGLAPGPAVGKILKELDRMVLEHPRWNQKQKLLQIIKDREFGT